MQLRCFFSFSSSVLNLICAATWSWSTPPCLHHSHPLTPSTLNNLGLVYLWQWFNDLQNYSVVGWASVRVDISTPYCPVCHQPSHTIYHDSRHDTWATPNRPFVSLLNKTCQVRKRSEDQRELRGFENCSRLNYSHRRIPPQVVPQCILLKPNRLQRKIYTSTAFTLIRQESNLILVSVFTLQKTTNFPSGYVRTGANLEFDMTRNKVAYSLAKGLQSLHWS